MIVRHRIGECHNSNTEVEVIIVAGIFTAVACPNPENTLAVLIVVAKVGFIPCAESAQILSEKPGGAVEIETVYPFGDVFVAVARACAVTDALERELPPGIAAFEPFVFEHDTLSLGLG